MPDINAVFPAPYVLGAHVVDWVGLALVVVVSGLLLLAASKESN